MFKTILLGILAVVLVIALAFGSGVLDLKFMEYFGVRRASVQRTIFKENKSYIESMASDLAKYRYELQREQDEIAKQAIKDLIRSKYADFNIDNLQDYSLKTFLREIRGGY